MITIRELLADGFALIKSNNFDVEKLKISKKQLKLLLKNNKYKYKYKGYLWGAEIRICNYLKNPVIVGENNCLKAIFNKKWILVKQ